MTETPSTSTTPQRIADLPPNASAPVWVINGTRYPLLGPGAVGVRVWRKTITPATGLTIPTFAAMWEDIDAVGDEGARFATEEELLGSDRHVDAMVVSQWIARHAAGDQVTLDEQYDVPIDASHISRGLTEDDEVMFLAAAAAQAAADAAQAAREAADPTPGPLGHETAA